MTYDSVRGKVVMFGGTASGVGYVNDTWEYDCSDCASIASYGSGCGSSYPLTLSSNAPTLGSVWHLSLLFAEWAPNYAFFFGDTLYNPGLDLGAGGATGCFAYMNGNLGAVITGDFGFTSSITMPIPNLPQLIGYEFMVQGLTGSTSTPAGFVTSNGIKAVIGY